MLIWEQRRHFGLICHYSTSTPNQVYQAVNSSLSSLSLGHTLQRVSHCSQSLIMDKAPGWGEMHWGMWPWWSELRLLLSAWYTSGFAVWLPECLLCSHSVLWFRTDSLPACTLQQNPLNRIWVTWVEIQSSIYFHITKRWCYKNKVYSVTIDHSTHHKPGVPVPSDPILGWHIVLQQSMLIIHPFTSSKIITSGPKEIYIWCSMKD